MYVQVISDVILTLSIPRDDSDSTSSTAPYNLETVLQETIPLIVAKVTHFFLLFPIVL